MDYNEYVKELGKHLKVLDKAIGGLDYLQANIGIDIDALSELRGEICERAERAAQALDLNRQISKETDFEKT